MKKWKTREGKINLFIKGEIHDKKIYTQFIYD